MTRGEPFGRTGWNHLTTAINLDLPPLVDFAHQPLRPTPQPTTDGHESLDRIIGSPAAAQYGETQGMERQPPEDVARKLIASRFPDAQQAWLGGSVYVGRATETSDLDISVLLADVAVHRESLTYLDWPVELFVHTEASARYFVEKDRAQRKPTMARLIANSIPLLPEPQGSELRQYCVRTLEAGPPPLSEAALQLARYSLTDLLDDLRGGGSAILMSAIAVEIWRRTGELLLASQDRWSGTGKWLVRELEALDYDAGTQYAARFHPSPR